MSTVAHIQKSKKQIVIDYAQIIETQKQNLLNELIEFLKQPSIAARNEGMQQMAKNVEAKLKEIGAKTQMLTVDDSYPYIYAELGDGPVTLVIYDHYDVQPPEPLNLWDNPPFNPTIKDGKIIARGVADNKGNLLFRIQAIKMILENEGKLPIKVKWVIEGEEEIGSPNLKRFAGEYGHLWKDADICLWETGGVDSNDDPAMSLGLKGILYVELESSLGGRDLHSGDASLVDSAVWNLIYALASLRDRDGNVLIKGFNDSIKFPSVKEWEIMQKDKFDPENYLKTVGHNKFLANRKDKQKILFRHYFGGTCNICGIWAGYTQSKGIKTVIPQKAYAKLDFRLVKDQDPDEVLRLLREHLERYGFSNIKVTKLIDEPVAKTDINNPLLQKVIDLISKGYNRPMNLRVTAGGSGPMYFVADKFGIPVFHLGAGYPDTKAHAPNENVRIKDYLKAIEIFIKVVKGLGE